MGLASRAFVLALAAACSADAVQSTEPTGPTPLRYESANFTFHYGAMDTATIAQTALVVEAERSRIVADLGGTEPPRVSVWLYSDHGDLERALNPLIGPIPSWASGAAPRRDQIHMMSPNAAGYGSYTTMVVNLVHEFVHCVLLTINATIGNNPRWLWESVAVYESGQFRDPRALTFMAGPTPPTLASLDSFDSTRIYEVGYTIGEFIVSRFGKTALRSLIANNGDVQDALGIPPVQFEADWFAFVRQRYGF